MMSCSIECFAVSDKVQEPISRIVMSSDFRRRKSLYSHYLAEISQHTRYLAFKRLKKMNFSVSVELQFRVSLPKPRANRACRF
jgi:hypothetical protein